MMFNKMQFNITCVKEHLREKGFVFTVRGYDLKDGFVEVDGIGRCYRRKIGEIKDVWKLGNYSAFSGFYHNLIEDGINEWWWIIEKMCKDKPKFLYLIILIKEGGE